MPTVPTALSAAALLRETDERMAQALENFFQRSRIPIQDAIVRAIATQMTPAFVATAQTCLDWLSAYPDALSAAFADQFRRRLARYESVVLPQDVAPPLLQLLDDEKFRRQLAEDKAFALLSETLLPDMLVLFRRLQGLRSSAPEAPDPAEAYGPRQVLHAMSRAFDTQAFETAHGTLLLQCATAPLLDTLKHTYTALNQFLFEQGIQEQAPGRRLPPARTRGGEDQSGQEVLAHIQSAAARADGAPVTGMASFGGGAPAGGLPSHGFPGRLIERLEDWLAVPLPPAAPQAGGAPALALRQLQQVARDGGTGAFDLAVLDAVAGLFEYILADPAVSPRYKAEIAHLEIPALRVALVSPAFFSDDQHPARRLIDLLGLYSRRFPEDHPAHAAALDQVQAGCVIILADPEHPAEAFAHAHTLLAAWLDDEEARTRASLAAEVARLEQIERQELGTLLALENLHDLTGRYPAPESVLRRLEAAWVPHMASLYVAETGEGPGWRTACTTLQQLFVSLQTPDSDAARETRLQAIPRINAELRSGLLAQGAAPAQLKDFFNAITATQECWVRPAVGHPEAVVNIYTPQGTFMPNKVSREEIVSLAHSLADVPASDPILQQAEQLLEGDWVDFEPPYEGLTTARVAWVGVHGYMLFCDSEGEQRFSLDCDRLAVEIRAGRAHIPEQSLTRKAMLRLKTQLAAPTAWFFPPALKFLRPQPIPQLCGCPSRHGYNRRPPNRANPPRDGDAKFPVSISIQHDRDSGTAGSTPVMHIPPRSPVGQPPIPRGDPMEREMPDNSVVVNLNQYERSRRAQVSGETLTLLHGSRDLLIEGATRVLTRQTEAMENTLLAMADRSPLLDTRNMYYGAQGILNKCANELLAACKDAYCQAFNAFAHNREKPAISDVPELSLVGDQDFEITLAVEKATSRLRYNCAEELIALDARIAHLTGRGDLTENDNPLGPRALCEALLDGITRMQLGQNVRIVLLNQFDLVLTTELAHLYQSINQYLVDHGVLPDLKVGAKNRARNAATGSGAVAAQAVQPGNDIFKLFEQLAGSRQVADERAGGGTTVGYSGFSLLDSLSQLQTGAAMMLPGGARFELPLLEASSIRNVLRGLQQSPVMQTASPLDAVQVDAVAMLFDVVFEEAAIPDRLKAQIARLQIPVLKAAMLDRNFFLQPRHPVRRMLDATATLSVHLPDNEAGNARLDAISQVVSRVLDSFEQDIAVFDSAAAELEAMGSTLEETLEETVDVSLQPDIAQLKKTERAELAPVVVHDFINRALSAGGALRSSGAAPRPPEGRVSGGVPLAGVSTGLPFTGKDQPIAEALREFLRRDWAQLLTMDYVNEGEQGAHFNSHVETMRELVWSVQPKADMDARLMLVRILPGLLKRLREGAAEIALPQKMSDRFFATLVILHANAVRPNAQPVPLPDIPPEESGEMVAPPTLAAVAIETASSSPEPVAPEIEDDFALRARTLSKGDWVEFHYDDGTFRWARLGWVSGVGNTYLFSDQDGMNSFSIGLHRLADKLRRGEAVLVERKSITETAFGKLMNLFRQKLSPA